ncbi:hypothetical protein [Streptomyces scopuliridis]
MTSEQSSGPAPRVLADTALSHFLGERQFGTLATVGSSWRGRWPSAGW